jgi:hypothetical protein
MADSTAKFPCASPGARIGPGGGLTCSITATSVEPLVLVARSVMQRSCDGPGDVARGPVVLGLGGTVTAANIPGPIGHAGQDAQRAFRRAARVGMVGDGVPGSIAHQPAHLWIQERGLHDLDARTENGRDRRRQGVRRQDVHVAALDERRRVQPGPDQPSDRIGRALGFLGAKPGRGRLRERTQMRGGVLVELQRPGERVEHMRRGMMVAALLQPQLVVRTDASERRQLLTPQPRNAAATDVREADVFGAHQFTPCPQVLAQRSARRHGSTIPPRRPIPSLRQRAARVRRASSSRTGWAKPLSRRCPSAT